MLLVEQYQFIVSVFFQHVSYDITFQCLLFALQTLSPWVVFFVNIESRMSDLSILFYCAVVLQFDLTIWYHELWVRFQLLSTISSSKEFKL